MRVKKKRPVAHFVSLRDFCRSLGLYHSLAMRLITLGVLEPDAYLDAKPIFSADLGKLAQAKAAVAVYKVRRNRAHQNIRELEHV